MKTTPDHRFALVIPSGNCRMGAAEQIKPINIKINGNEIIMNQIVNGVYISQPLLVSSPTIFKIINCRDFRLVGTPTGEEGPSLQWLQLLQLFKVVVVVKHLCKRHSFGVNQKPAAWTLRAEGVVGTLDLKTLHKNISHQTSKIKRLLLRQLPDRNDGHLIDCLLKTS